VADSWGGMNARTRRRETPLADRPWQWMALPTFAPQKVI
jgi:hypothetical protein